MGLVRRLAKRAVKSALHRLVTGPTTETTPTAAAPQPIEPEPKSAPEVLVKIGQVPVVPYAPAAARSPTGRRILEAIDLTAAEKDDGVGIRIKAQPIDPETCRFMFDRPLLDGRSWYFAAEGEGLAAELMRLGVRTVLVDGSILSVTRKPTPEDWRPLAQQIGAAARAWIESGAPVVPETIVEKIPAEEELRDRVQSVIDDEVNPGVAAHSGYITLTHVRGNSVYISMGGGCQGCSAADVTLKDGIHKVFRDRVPEIGAIYDETDHAAGQNPYFS